VRNSREPLLKAIREPSAEKLPVAASIRASLSRPLPSGEIRYSRGKRDQLSRYELNRILFFVGCQPTTSSVAGCQVTRVISPPSGVIT